MKCSQARGLLSAHLDQDLTFEEKSQLLQHLDRCADCGQAMESLQRVQGLLRDLPETDPGPGFYEALRERISAADTRREPAAIDRRLTLADLLQQLFATPWLRPAAAAVFGLAVGMFLGLGAGQWGGSGGAGGEADSPMARGEELAPTGSVGDLPASESMGLPDQGPLADLDLRHLEALSDSLQLEGEEYILEPYVTDPHWGLVPQRVGSVRTVSGERDAQGDGYVTF